MIYRSNTFILFTVSVISVLTIPVRAENAGYDHFVGTYAYEATPYWEEFEIVRSGSNFSLQIPDNEDWKLAFKRSNGLLVSKGDEGEDFSLCYDKLKELYTLTRTTQMSTSNGVKDFSDTIYGFQLLAGPGDNFNHDTFFRKVLYSIRS